MLPLKKLSSPLLSSPSIAHMNESDELSVRSGSNLETRGVQRRQPSITILIRKSHTSIISIDHSCPPPAPQVCTSKMRGKGPKNGRISLDRKGH
jgi:hypothetical protein